MLPSAGAYRNPVPNNWGYYPTFKIHHSTMNANTATITTTTTIDRVKKSMSSSSSHYIWWARLEAEDDDNRINLVSRWEEDNKKERER